MLDVTVLLLEDTFASTAIGPMEVFRHAGTLWNYLTGTAPRSPLPRDHSLDSMDAPSPAMDPFRSHRRPQSQPSARRTSSSFRPPG